MICHAVVAHALSFLSQVVHMSSIRSSSYHIYIMHFSNGIHLFIQHIVDVAADANCGFWVIATLLGMGEDSWPQVWMNLLQELDNYG